MTCSPSAASRWRSNATLTGVTYAPGPSGNAYAMNPTVDQANQYVTVPDDATLSPLREFSFSVVVYRNTLASYPEWSTILTKGAWGAEHYALYLAADGKAAFVINRSVHKKCWYCWFNSACDDGSCADSDYAERTVLTTTTPVVTPNEWTTLTATFGSEVMRLYKNGQVAAELATSVYWPDGFYRYQTSTNGTYRNALPLRLGISAPGQNPARQFSGMLDDVELFGVGLTSSQARSHYSTGVCVPP